MSHTRFALGFTRHRKVHVLSDAAFRLWVSAMDYAREQLTDGRVTEADLDMLPRCPQRGKRRQTLVKELVDADLWEVDGADWMIHDFLVWQDSAAMVRQKQAEARERMRRVRANRARTYGEPEGEQAPVFARTSSEVRSTVGSGRRSGSGDPKLTPGSKDLAGSPRADEPSAPGAGVGITDSEQEKPCPAELAEQAERVGLPEELAKRYGVTPEDVRAAIRSFVSYWVAGAGAGLKRRHWMRKLRGRIQEQHERGQLAGLAPKPKPARARPAVDLGDLSEEPSDRDVPPPPEVTAMVGNLWGPR